MHQRLTFAPSALVCDTFSQLNVRVTLGNHGGHLVLWLLFNSLNGALRGERPPSENTRTEKPR